ncbi:hypothetical protein C9374_008362 [Naegleria lovaniensis]|uniref:Uncharacterized protein n=1 Tax=Naegleria lovaniensis TaxID=51637 RepID=A0AA88GF38_NAELO|nr:uncharacterized protein C9374_008362 [Naegleria lovaniensis]KAG2378219.1 hypothetical protein C9374_008362 [Naegleria lovaniensis]
MLFESTQLYHLMWLSKRDTCPPALATPTNPLTNMRALIPETDLVIPIISQFSPSLWRSYFLFKDALSETREELWGFTRNKDVPTDKYGMNSEFKRIDFFNERNLKILEMISGAYFTFFITSDGVYGIGENDDGQLGIGNNITQLDFVKITSLSLMKIRKIQCGNFYSMVLTEDSEVFGFGQNHWGQLGIGEEQENVVLVPTQLQMFGKGEIELETIYCGEYNTFFVTTASEKTNHVKQLYGCGYTEFGQLGPQVPSTTICVKTPILIEFFSKEQSMSVKTMTSSYGFSFVMTMSNEIYSFGLQEDGELGIGITNSDINGFTKIDFNLSPGDDIQYMACGNSSGIFISSKEGRVFHTGLMPIFITPYQTSSQTNHTPFQIFNVSLSQHTFVKIEIRGDTYILVNKVISTPTQLLGRLQLLYQQLLDDQQFTDIQFL